LKTFLDFTPAEVSQKKEQETNEMNTLTQIIENTFNPSAKDMRLLTEAIQANKELAGLFNSTQTKVIVEKSSTAAPRKPRAPIQKKDDAVRCHAVVWNLEMNEATGELVPKRCTRGCEGYYKFCKQHNLVDGKKCAGCSAYFGEDIIHQFKHEHMGTIHEPSYIFDKYHADVLKIYQKSIAGSVPKSDEPATDVPVQEKKKVGRPSKKTKTVADDKPKREANDFIKFLNSKRVEIKAQILLEQPDLKGRFLTGAISKRAGELWKTEKGSMTVVDEESKVLSSQEEPTEEAPAPAVVEEEAQDEDEEEIKLKYNDTLKVWIDEETDLYYMEKDSASATGSVVNGVLKPFKVRK
jgi:hypothetical protein